MIYNEFHKKLVTLLQSQFLGNSWYPIDKFKSNKMLWAEGIRLVFRFHLHTCTARLNFIYKQ